ncbi:MAG TPA: hypothetical protein VIP77_04335 [Jiangellaceae bacterium]
MEWKQLRNLLPAGPVECLDIDQERTLDPGRVVGRGEPTIHPGIASGSTNPARPKIFIPAWG